MRLYERATDGKPPGPLFHSGRGFTFWSHTADYLGDHRGSAPVLLTGLYGKFQLRVAGSAWIACRAAIVPPSRWHELRFHGEPFSALYIEPGHGGLSTLLPLLSSARESDGVLVGLSQGATVLRTLYEDRACRPSADLVLRDLLEFSGNNGPATVLDPRIATAVDSLDDCDNCVAPAAVSMLAGRAGLSSSRFQHLFTSQVGVPFRRYRLWQRLRRAWGGIFSGSNITTAAHGAGFFDSAHFAHEYRRTFGRPCSGPW